MRDSGNEVDFLTGTPIHFILEFPQGIFVSKCILIGQLPEPISKKDEKSDLKLNDEWHRRPVVAKKVGNQLNKVI